MDSIIGSVGRVANVKVRNDDDLIDRLNHFYTTGILIIFTVVVSARQYVGDPIRCWCPAEFPGTHVDYTNNICWISNTYYIPLDEVNSMLKHRNRVDKNHILVESCFSIFFFICGNPTCYCIIIYFKSDLLTREETSEHKYS